MRELVRDDFCFQEEVMREIPLTQGQVALVDDEDYGELSKHKWYALRSAHSQGFVAARESHCQMVLMHHVITGAQPGQLVDHKNHVILDNRHEPRICTRSEISTTASLRRAPAPIRAFTERRVVTGGWQR